MCPEGRLCGIVVLDKPAGVASNPATRRVQRAFGERSAGHLGTLDPFATGVLPVMLGQATRLGPLLEGGDKVYLAEMALGVTTDTLDRDGREAERRPVPGDAVARLRKAVPALVGSIRQRVPDYSAAKVAGVRRCDLARGGRVVPSAEKEVVVRSIRVVREALPIVGIEVVCGRGTFIRQIVADLGEAIGCGAHAVSLRRTRSGPFTADAAVGMDRIERADPGERSGLLADLGDALPGRRLEAGDAALADLARGRPAESADVAAGGWAEGDAVLVVAAGVLRAIGVVRGGAVWPRRVFGEPGIPLHPVSSGASRGRFPAGP